MDGLWTFSPDISWDGRRTMADGAGFWTMESALVDLLDRPAFDTTRNANGFLRYEMEMTTDVRFVIDLHAREILQSWK